MFQAFSVKKVARMLILMLAFILIFSFIAHDIIPHQHPHAIFGSGIKAIFHGNDRKSWYLALLLAVFVATNLFRKWKLDTRILTLNFIYLKIKISKIFDPILQALQTGILNPKLFY